jgi:hypothetical protein
MEIKSIRDLKINTDTHFKRKKINNIQIKRKKQKYLFNYLSLIIIVIIIISIFGLIFSINIYKNNFKKGEMLQNKTKNEMIQFTQDYLIPKSNKKIKITHYQNETLIYKKLKI